MSGPLATVLGGASALVAAMGIGRFAYTPLLPYMQRDSGLTIAAAGYLASANFLGYLAGALLAMGVRRERRGAWFAVGLATSVLTTLAMSVTDSPWLLGLIRTASGIASAWVLIHGSAIVLDALARAGRPTLFSVLYAGVGVGIAGSAGIVEWMSRAQAGAGAMWLAIGVAAAVFALPGILVRDPPAIRGPAPVGTASGRTALDAPASAARDHAPPALAAAGERRALAWLTLAYGCLGFGYVITATFLVVILRGRAEWRAYEMLAWMCVGLAGAPSNYVWMRIAQRVDPYRAMIAAYVLEAIGVLAAVSGASLGLVMLGAVLLGGTFMGITALGITTGRLLARGDSGPIVGRMTAAFGFGQIVGPALGGWLAERTGSFTWPSLLAAATLVAAAAMVAQARREALSPPTR